MARDKWMHLLAGLSLSLAAGILWGSLAGLATALIIGAAKELIWDLWLKKGTAEWWDFIATAIGGSIGAVLIYLTLG